MGVRSLGGVVLAVMLVAAGCGDDDAVPFDSTTPPSSSTVAPPITSTSTTTPVVPSTTGPTATTAPTTTTTTTVPVPTAADSLAAFFVAAATLDESIRSAAGLFNAGYDPATATVSGAAATAIDDLDAAPVGALVPAGLSLDLETAVLGVFADLNSRVAALQGAVRLLDGHTDNIPYVLDCLENGGTSADRFAADVDNAMALAVLEAPPVAAPDSIPAGVLAARVETIRSMNFGCDGCGGIAYTAAIPIDWEAKTIMEGVGFEATFDGASWQILIYAC